MATPTFAAIQVHKIHLTPDRGTNTTRCDGCDVISMFCESVAPTMLLRAYTRQIVAGGDDRNKLEPDNQTWEARLPEC